MKETMKLRLRKFLGVAAALCVMLTAGASAQTAGRAGATDPLAALPAADAVMFVDTNRVLNEVVPKVLAGDQARLAQVNADLDRFKQRTGVDPRSVSRLAVGARYVTLASGATKIEPVVIAGGRFDARTIVAAGRLAAKGKYAEQQHAGRTIYVFTLDEQMKMLGLLNMNIGELAVTALDGNTLALGKPETVRATLDATRVKAANAPNAALIALANRNPNAILGFGGNLPANLFANLDLGNPEITSNLAAVRQVFGSLASTATGFEMLTTARTTDARAARSLSEMVEALRGFAGLAVGNVQGDRGRLARSALESLRITTETTDVSLRITLQQADVLTLVRGL